MNDFENYKTIIDSIFGENTARFETIDVKSTDSNNVLKALNSNDNFLKFGENFVARLKRLNKIYSRNDCNRLSLINQINLIADKKNWEGAFAELTSFDCLNQDLLLSNDYLKKEIDLDVTFDKELTFSDHLEKKESNLDGFFSDYGVYFDVKCLKDNINEILNKIYKQIQRETGLKFHIDASYPRDISYKEFQIRRESLYSELKSKIINKSTYIDSEIINNLFFYILWEKGHITTLGTYNPFRHAENYFKTIFNYSNKLVINNPTLIVLVVFPWFNSTINNFSGNNETLYRSLCRRVFCQYKNINTSINELITNFKGGKTIFEVSKKISGIIIIEDTSLLSTNPDMINSTPYIYLNPNADNKIQNTFFEEVLKNLNHNIYDDFRFDNY